MSELNDMFRQLAWSLLKKDPHLEPLNSQVHLVKYLNQKKLKLLEMKKNYKKKRRQKRL